MADAEVVLLLCASRAFPFASRLQSRVLLDLRQPLRQFDADGLHFPRSLAIMMCS